jgi:hypothetical protein
MDIKKENFIPPQEEGTASNTIASCTCSDVEEARAFFQIVKKRLLNVNEWVTIAGFASADFHLCDENGTEVMRNVRPNDYFKIDVPGPGPVTGDGYDWVQVEAIDSIESEESEMTAIRVRPATNPGGNQKDVAHFFSNSATSSFIIERKKNIVTAGVYGRNEKPNTGAEKIIDKARNTAMAAVAITAFSKIQWKGLVDGLVKKEKV